MTAFVIEISVGGNVFPANRFRVTSGAYGSVGHADIMTSRQALLAAKVDLVALTIAAVSGVDVSISVTADQGPKVKIYGGEYMAAKWDFDRDSVTISSRDWAGVLVDEKRPLQMLAGGVAGIVSPGQTDDSTGISTQNQKVSQLVKSIAKEFSLTPVINIPAGQDQSIGTLLGSEDYVMTPIPQSLWGLLNLLARDTGNEVYVTPNKELVFGIPGQGAPTLNFTYKVPPLPANAHPVPTGADPTYPVRGLSVTHNPRRNLSFQVQVFSYNPTNGTLAKGSAVVFGTQATGSNNEIIKPGLWTGPAASQILGSLEGTVTQLPTYSFHVDGLTQAQADARAVAIANDIAKRELILNFTADLVPGLIPMNHMLLSGPADAIDQEFTTHDYYVNAYSHTFGLPGSSPSGGMDTEIMALDIQLEGKGTPLTQTAKTK